jgi:hypothetical protein
MLIYADDKYRILKSGRDYTLINIHAEYKCHGHFRKADTCFLLMRLMREQIVPKSIYLQDAALRLTTDESYKQKILNKQEKERNKLNFYNVNKGVR